MSLLTLGAVEFPTVDDGSPAAPVVSDSDQSSAASADTAAARRVNDLALVSMLSASGADDQSEQQ